MEVKGFEAPICVVGEAFCVPKTIDLVVRKKIKGLSDVCFEVTDVHGKLLLEVHGRLWSFQRRRVMFDAVGVPILSMHEKALAWRKKWIVRRGDGTIPGNLLATVERSNALQLKTQLDVFLPSNYIEDVCDFHVTGCYSSQSCKVYEGNSIIAEINHKYTWGSFLKGKESFVTRVYQGVDYAFIVALIVILHENHGS